MFINNNDFMNKFMNQLDYKFLVNHGLPDHSQQQPNLEAVSQARDPSNCTHVVHGGPSTIAAPATYRVGEYLERTGIKIWSSL